MRVPVLTYHSVNIIENTYRDNDHIALAADLETLARAGWRVVPLRDVVAWRQGTGPRPEGDKIAALSCDDGSWFDFHDLDHPTCGLQRSFLNILRDLVDKASAGAQHDLHITSFVIASPQAREELDKKGLIGRGWWGDEWWGAAQDSGLMEIACHSWDHVHPDLGQVAQQDQVKGDFARIDTFEDCEAQVRQAGDYIASRLGGKRPTLFAYPWGEASDYIREEYLPRFRAQHGFTAAFTTEPKPLEKTDSVWALPRLVFGRDWRSTEELEKLLSDSA